jgi:hypothetical protein
MGITPTEIKQIEALADQYSTGDIAGDYLSATQDLLAQKEELLANVKEAMFDATDVHTEESLKEALLGFMNAKSLGSRVIIVDSEFDLDGIDAEIAEDQDAVAWTRDGKAVLIADRIRKGKERGVFLHEVGAHLGFQRILDTASFQKLVNQVRAWAAMPGNSKEATLARKALVRVAAANTEKSQQDTELMAYFVEEAADAWMKPKALSNGLSEWFANLWGAFKKVLIKMGIEPERLTAQDLVDLAYGAANYTIRDTYHGTDKVFDAFSDSKVKELNSSLRGWGHYLTEAEFKAKKYTKGKGDVVATAYNANKEDLLDLETPMAQQSKVVQDAVAKLMPKLEEMNDGPLDIRAMDGEEFYQKVASLLAGSDDAAEFRTKYKATSQLLNGAGIVGSAYNDGTAQNYVIYSDKNVEQVMRNPENIHVEKVQFSKAAQPQVDAALKQQVDDIDRIRAMLSDKTKDNWATVTDVFKKFAPAFLSNYQLVEQFGGKLKPLKQYVGLQQVMTQERTRAGMKFHHISVEWDKLEAGVKDRLNKLMLRATLDQMHPDLSFTHPDNKHLDAGAQAKHAALAAQYNALGPNAQKVYQDAKNALKEQWGDREKSYYSLVDYTFSGRLADAKAKGDTDAVTSIEKDKADAKAAYKKQLDTLKGPYFPLMRFGTYLAIGESQELVDMKEKVKAAVGDERHKLEAQLEKMKKDPKHYAVSAHETRGQLNAAKRDMASKGLTPREDMTDQYLDGVSRDSAKIVAELGHMVSATLDEDSARAVNDGLANVYLRSLPEMHALRREAHRKGIEGANPDMLRAFASAGQSGSFYQSRLKHGAEMADTLFQMKREAKGNIDLQHVHREMEKRMALDMQFKETPVQDFIASASWVYHMGMSPSNWVLNATQPWLVSVPMMAGRFGMMKSTRELGRAYADATKIMKDARLKEGKIDWWSGISENSLTDKEERTALRKLMERGIVDEGLQHELNMFADGKSRGLAQFNRWMGWGNQQVELVNRTSTALAAFRLAKQSGMDYEKALQYAYDTTLNSQFDYSQEGTARFMREGGGVPMAKLVFQFRKFQQGMLYALGSNIRKLADPAQRKEAAYTLAYLSLTSGMAAGATGLPFAAAVFALANAFLDDDDPEGDAETQFANWLFDVTGDKKAADVLRKGLPAAWGWDVSKRIGLGDVASPFPMGRFDGKTGAEMGGQVTMAAMGPAAGLSARMYDGIQMMGEGEFQKGAEKMLPKVAADLMKAGRYATEGFSDGKGNPTGTGLDGADVVSKAFGFNPTRESDYYEGTAAKKNTESAVKSRIGSIGNQFKEAVRTGDMGDVREMINKFNADHPENPITGKQEAQWRKDVRDSAQGRTGAGVKMGNKKDGIYNPVARFAQ